MSYEDMLKRINDAIITLGNLNTPIALMDRLGAPLFNIRSSLMTVYENLSQKAANEAKEESEDAAEPVSEDGEESDPS